MKKAPLPFSDLANGAQIRRAYLAFYRQPRHRCASSLLTPLGRVRCELYWPHNTPHSRWISLDKRKTFHAKVPALAAGITVNWPNLRWDKIFDAFVARG